MSPRAALHDPVFHAYLGIALGLLLVAGTVLAVLQWGFRIELRGVWKTYRSWLWMVPLVALAIFAGRVAVVLGVAVIACLAAREFVRVTGLGCDRWMTVAVYAGIIAFGAASLLEIDFGFVLESGLAVILVLPILRNRVQGAVRSMSLGILAFLTLGWMFGHLGLLAQTYGSLCYVLFATELNDVAAFTCGKMWGRHPLRSEISARKTWEGALGALLVSLALPWVLHFSFPFFGPWQLLLAGLIVGIGAPFGDLFLSLLKRDLGAKDWSSAIPGHGGILDRIDSLIFVAPLFMLMTGYYYPGR